jgi:hypothetical protein
MVTGRLGHDDGITTLRHSAVWVGSADQAANAIGSRMPTLGVRDGAGWPYGMRLSTGTPEYLTMTDVSALGAAAVGVQCVTSAEAPT